MPRLIINALVLYDLKNINLRLRDHTHKSPFISSQAYAKKNLTNKWDTMWVCKVDNMRLPHKLSYINKLSLPNNTISLSTFGIIWSEIYRTRLSVIASHNLLVLFSYHNFYYKNIISSFSLVRISVYVTLLASRVREL